MDAPSPRRTRVPLSIARILLTLAAINMVAFLWWDHHRTHRQATSPSLEPETINLSVFDLWSELFQSMIRFRIDLTDPGSIMVWTLFLFFTAYHLLILLLPWCVTLLSRSLPLRSLTRFIVLIPVGLILIGLFFFGPTLEALPLITYLTLPAIALFLIPETLSLCETPVNSE